jgi:outer membrane protein OmpA-like peptidoglycan-associated protein
MFFLRAIMLCFGAVLSVFAIELEATGYRFIEDEMQRVRVVALESPTQERWRKILSGAERASLETTFKVTRQDDQGGVGLSSKELFVFNGGQLSPRGRATLARLADYLKGIPGDEIVIVAHSESGASEEQNQLETLELAWQIAEFLIERHDLPPELFSLVGAGSTEPVFLEAGPNSINWLESKANNRRIELIFPLVPGERVQRRAFNVAATGITVSR